MKKFLIVKTSSLGDIIQAFPALSYLRSRFPQAQIDWVVEKPFAELVLAHPQVDQVYLIDSKAWRKAPFAAPKEIIQFRKEIQKTLYDAVFDLQGNVKSGFITSLARSPSKVGFGWKTVHEKANTLFTNQRYNPPEGVNIRDDNLLVVQGYFHDAQPYADTKVLLNIAPAQEQVIRGVMSQINGKGVMVCPGSAWPNKQLTKEALGDFLSRLQDYLKCCFVLVWGSQSELQLCQELLAKLPNSVLSSKLSLPTLQNLMDRMELVVAMDSLPLHLAGTARTKTFSVFGASLASKFKPAGREHLSLQGICPYGRTFEKRCPILRTCKTGACIREFSGLAVFESFKNQWNSLVL